MVDLSKAPYYNSVKEEMDKGYTEVVFTSGKAVQSRELSEIGSYARENLKRMAKLLYKSGTILSGCTIQNIDIPKATATMTTGSVFVDGEIFDVVFEKPTGPFGEMMPAYPGIVSKTVPIKTTGTETIFVEIVSDIVDYVKDPLLLDPAEGFDNYQEPGAVRLRKIARFISTSHPDYSNPAQLDNPRIPLYTLVDGEIVQDQTTEATNNVTESKPADSSNLDTLDIIAQRNYETHGNYLTDGYGVHSIDCADNTKIGLVVEPGVAYINGIRRENTESRKLFIDKTLLKHENINEDHAIKNDILEYKLNLSPVIAARVSAPVKAVQSLTFTSLGTKNIITPPTGLNVYKIIRVYTEGPTGKTYTMGSDYTLSGNEITWLNSGEHPTGAFKVDYTYKTILTEDKYKIVQKGIYELVLKLPVNSLGIAEIPSQYFNPSIQYIENEAGIKLDRGKDWYQQGNRIKILTTTNDSLPVEVIKSVDTLDTVPVIFTDVESVSYFTEYGEIKYVKYKENSDIPIDFMINKDYNGISWLEKDKNNYPINDDKYLATVKIATNASIHNITSVIVRFSYELQQDIYNNRVYDSYIQFEPGVIWGVDSNDTFTVNSTIARTRKDSICLNPDGTMSVIHGTVVGDKGIYETRVPDNMLKIADVIIKPTTANTVAIFQTDNYRVRMKDIRDMFSKVKDIDYNISLSVLEKYAENLAAGATLRGILTDGFLNLKMFDSAATWKFVQNEEQFAVPNIAEAKLYPGFKRFATNLEIDEDNTTAGKKDKVYVLSVGDSEALWLDQPFGTNHRSLTEGVYSSVLFPSIKITPDSDYFIAGASDLIGEDDEYSVIPTKFETYHLTNSGSLSFIAENATFNGKDATIEFLVSIPKIFAKENLFTFGDIRAEVLNSNTLVLKLHNGREIRYSLTRAITDWNHFAFVIPNHGDITGIKVFVNGVKLENPNVPEIQNIGSAGSTEYENIGAKSDLSLVFGPNEDIFISFIKVFNTGLSDKDIQVYMLSEIPTNTADLVGYYTGAFATELVNESVNKGLKNGTKVSGNISSNKINSDIIMAGNDPLAKNKHVVNTVDITEGNVRPTDTESTRETGRTSSTNTTQSGNIVTQTTTTTVTTRTDRTWYTRERKSQTTDYGNFLTDMKSAISLRRRKITISGSGLLANTDPIEVSFNGVKVNLFAPTTGVKGEKSTTDGCWKCDSEGNFVACFVIPKNTPIGMREVVMTAPGGYTAKANYWGAGNVVEKTKVTSQLDTIYWKENNSTTTNTTSSSTSSSWCRHCGNCSNCGNCSRCGRCNHCGFNCGRCHHCGSRCRTIPLAQTLYVNHPDLTKSVITDIIQYSDVMVTSVDIYVRSFNLTSQFFIGFTELTDSGYPSSGLDNWASTVKTFSGSDLRENGGKFEYGTAKYNVKFDNPIRLKGGKGYSMVVGSPDKDVRVWLAKIGEEEPTINNVKGKKVFSTPDKGVLLSSPNGRTWTAYIDEDLKYSMYIRDFFADGNLEEVDPSLSLIKTNNKGRSSIVEYKEVVFKTASGNNIEAPNFFKFDTMYSDSRDKTGYVKFEYKVRINSTYTSWKEFLPGTIINFDTPAEAIKIRAKLYSFSRYSSPSIDTSAALMVGEYNLPSYYISKTVQSGRYNRVDAYIDKFFNPTVSDIVFKYSPDGGYTWREPPIRNLEPLSLDSQIYGTKVPQYQYCLRDGLTLGAPEITELVMVDTPSNEAKYGTNGNKYEIAYCLKDIYDREGPLSKPKAFDAENNKTPKVKVKFDPNATGYAVYIRDITANGNFKLHYDSTITSKLKNNLNLSDNAVRIGPEGRLFPKKGVILIDGEYMRYSDKQNIDASTIELKNVERGVANMAISSDKAVHSIGTKVILADNCVLNRGSITGNITDLWKFSNYKILKDLDLNEDYYVFEDTIVEKNLTVKDTDTPLYDPTYPASFESSRLTFMVKFSNKDKSPTVGRPDLVPTAGRVILNTSFEAY